LGGREERVRVWDARDGAGRGSVGLAAEIVAARSSVATVGRVERVADAGENVVLDEELGTVASVDPVVAVQVVCDGVVSAMGVIEY
jgi:hypothetical protein